jgi:signal transduction protein with GAF and PtsI domain
VGSSTHAEEGDLMFGRKNVATAAGDAVDGVSPYVDQLAHDEKLRQRLAAAITAGAAARARAKKQTGLVGLATRLATDPVLRAQLAEVSSQLQKANGRLKKHRSHKLRNTVLLLAGAGAGAVVAAIPSLREAVLSKVGGDEPSGGSDAAQGYETAAYGTPAAASVDTEAPGA